jgi:hypothetical protein
VQSQDVKQLIDQLDSRRRGAVAESIRHTVEATDALTRATLLVAYGQLRTAEALENLSRIRFDEFSEVGMTGNYIQASNGPQEAIVSQAGAINLKDLSTERVSIPK